MLFQICELSKQNNTVNTEGRAKLNCKGLFILVNIFAYGICGRFVVFGAIYKAGHKYAHTKSYRSCTIFHLDLMSSIKTTHTYPHYIQQNDTNPIT